MAKFSSSFDKLRWQMYGGYGTETTKVDIDQDRRFASRNEVYYYEAGCIKIAGWFGRNPDSRHRTSIEAGVIIKMADEFNTPFFTPDGQKIPKSWLYDNPVLLHDREHGLYLTTNRPVWYAHREAEPYTETPVVLHVPPTVKEQNEKIKECNEVWLQCYTAKKMGVVFHDEKRVVMAPVSEWVVNPKSFADTPDNIKRVLSNAPVLREVVKKALTKTVKVPYLLNRRIENGRSTDK